MRRSTSVHISFSCVPSAISMFSKTFERKMLGVCVCVSVCVCVFVCASVGMEELKRNDNTAIHIYILIQIDTV